MERGSVIRRWMTHAEPYLWIAPALLCLFAVLGYPMLRSLAESFTDAGAMGQGKWVGVKNYTDLMSQIEFRTSLQNTLVFTGIAVALEMLLGLLCALLLDRLAVLRNLFQTTTLVPMMLTPVVVGLMWKLLWDTDFGAFNAMLKTVGLPPVDWLARAGTAMGALIVTEVWQNTPYVTMILLAGLQAIPRDPYEAAAIDGASWFQSLRYITLPLLRPAMLIALIIRTLFAFRVFETIFVLTGGGPADGTLTLSILIHRIGFRYFKIGLASSLSWVMLFVCLLCTVVYLRILRSDKEAVR